MSYTPTNWIDGETPVNAENLNKLEEAVQQNAGVIDEINTARDNGEFKGDPGKDGTSVTVKSVSESTADGGSNVVTFSDGKKVTIKNGSKGSTGATGAAGAAGKDGASAKITATEFTEDNAYRPGRTGVKLAIENTDPATGLPTMESAYVCDGKTFSSVTVDTLEAGSNATAKIAHPTSDSLQLQLGIPKGDKGDPGVPGDTITLSNVVIGAGDDLQRGVEITVTSADGATQTQAIYSGARGKAGDTIALTPVVVGAGDDMKTGVSIVVTSADGATQEHTIYNGDKGAKGDTGPAYTLTTTDKNTIVNSVKSALPTLTVTGVDADGVSHSWTMYGVAQ